MRFTISKGDFIMKKKPKIFAIIGMTAGVLALAFGIVILAGAFYHYSDYIYSRISKYDYGFATLHLLQQ